MTQPLLRATLVAACLAILATFTPADEPSYFRRHHGLASNDKQPLPDRFESKDQQVWRQELPPGISTPCVYGDSIYLTTYTADKEELATVALDRATGKVKWKQVAPAKKIEPFHRTGSPAASTPACDGRRLYVFFGSFGLLCYDLDGKLLWSKPMGPFQDEFGASSSPVLVDGKVILNEDHDVNSFLIAVDAETGETAWRTPRTDATRSYASPLVWDDGETKQVIVAGALQLAAYDVKDGRKQWWVNGLSRIVDTTPVRAGNLMYLATWTPGGDETERISMEPYPEALKKYDKNGDKQIAKTELPEGAVLTRFFRIDLDQDEKLDNQEWDKHRDVFARAQNVAMAVRPGGRGDVTKTHVKWIHRRGLPVVPSPLVYRGVMYMVKDGGVITSVDAASGKLLKQGRARGGASNYYSSLVAGDGKVYVCSERGVVTVLKAGRPWSILSAHDFEERMLSTPVISDGKVYLRTDKALYCFAK